MSAPVSDPSTIWAPLAQLTQRAPDCAAIPGPASAANSAMVAMISDGEVFPTRFLRRVHLVSAGVFMMGSSFAAV